MRTIDIHAHLVPRSLWRAADARREWRAQGALHAGQ